MSFVNEDQEALPLKAEVGIRAVDVQVFVVEVDAANIGVHVVATLGALGVTNCELKKNGS